MPSHEHSHEAITPPTYTQHHSSHAIAHMNTCKPSQQMHSYHMTVQLPIRCKPPPPPTLPHTHQHTHIQYTHSRRPPRGRGRPARASRRARNHRARKHERREHNAAHAVDVRWTKATSRRGSVAGSAPHCWSDSAAVQPDPDFAAVCTAVPRRVHACCYNDSGRPHLVRKNTTTNDPADMPRNFSRSLQHNACINAPSEHDTCTTAFACRHMQCATAVHWMTGPVNAHQSAHLLCTAPKLQMHIANISTDQQQRLLHVGPTTADHGRSPPELAAANL